LQSNTATVHDQASIIASHRSLQMGVSTENQCCVDIASAAFDLSERRRQIAHRGQLIAP
jgi:hypothetical protein